MKKSSVTLILFFLAFNYILAQNSFIKFFGDFSYDYRGKKVMVFKGEIIPFIKSEKKGKITIIIDRDTIRDVSVSRMNFKPFSNANTAYLEWASKLVFLKDNDSIIIDVTSIPQIDTVTLISENGKQFAQLIKNRKQAFTKISIDKYFRLLITNSPTVFYLSDSLTKVNTPIYDRDMDGIPDSVDKCPDKEGVKSDDPEKNGCPEDAKPFLLLFEWWQYLLLFIALIISIYGGFSLWKSRKLKPNEVRFSGHSLTEFADIHGGLDNLSFLNPGLLIPSKSEWQKIKSDKRERDKHVRRLQGKKIVVKASDDVSNEIYNSNLQEKKSQSMPFFGDNIIESSLQQKNQKTIDQLSNQLSQVESNLINAIRSTNLKGNENLSEINKLTREISELKSDKKKLESDKINLSSTISQLDTDNATLNVKFNAINAEKGQILTELSTLQEKTILVDYLSGYCENVSVFFNLCNKVSAESYKYLDRISRLSQKQALPVMYLILKFQNNVCASPIGNWTQIVEDVKESGTTNNKQIKSSFRQISSIEDRRKQFQRLLFSEVLVQYCSDILILAEAFRNLDQFQISSDISTEAQNTFGRYVMEIVSKSKTIGIEIKYIPLFKNYEEYLGLVESIDIEKSPVFREVSGLEKGAIAEIVSYGIKTAFHDSKTIIILV
jgi:hypothetical protein